MFTAIFPATVLGIYPLQNSVLVSHNNYSFELKNDQLSLFQNHSKKVQYWDYADNTICMQNVVTKEYSLINNKGTNPLNSLEAERVLKRNIVEIGDYKVTTQYADFILDPSTYHFENTSTGKKSSLTSDGTLLTVINDYLYIRKDSSIIKFNTDFEQIATKNYTEDRLYFNQEYFAGMVFSYICQEAPRIEVFDLASFETLQVLSLPPYKGSRMIWNLVKTNELIVFTCGDTTYGWDGVELQLFFVGQEVSCIENKGKFVYISFVNDSVLYAYSPDLKTLIHKEDALVEGYYLYYMTSQGDKNFAHFWQCDCQKVGGLEYFVSWSDDEFFSDTPCIADLESPIFKEIQIPVDDNFSLLLNIKVGNNYGTVARQTLAALGEALDIHSFYPNRFGDVHGVHSERFTGTIELRFENSEQLDAEQKLQLQSACKNLLKSYINQVGAATGELCSISFVFA